MAINEAANTTGYVLSEAAVADFRRGFQGAVLVPGDAGYEDARKVFNAMIDRHPSLIVRPADVTNVQRAVSSARMNNLEIAVRSGGHSVSGLSVCEGGILIDLGGLKTIEVDPLAKTARAGGGVLWGELDAATQEYGLHTPGGRITTTGIGGFTTGGGYGWTSSKHGLACDNVISAQVVLADGQVVTASQDENADLLWAIRGGSGNFGIITEFEFRLHQLGPIVLAGLALWPIERAPEVLRGWRDYADVAPHEVSTGCVIVTAPPEDFVPEHLRGRTALGVAAMYIGDPETGAKALQPLRDLRPEVDLIQPMPYTAFQAMLDPMAPKGYRSYWRGEHMGALTDDAIDTFMKHAPALVSAAVPLSQMIIFRIGQGVSSIPEDSAAFSHRDANYLFHPISVWSDPRDDERLIAASRAFADAMRPFSTGSAYLNFTAEADRVRDAYGQHKYERLVALKQKYDPMNLFHMNQNIKPK